jgi:phage repressor protein C with HTH and peptisase S24 domain
MIFFRRVVGNSMKPTLKDGQLVMCHQVRDFKKGQIVVAFVNGREVIKRISKIQSGSVYLKVDSLEHAHKGKYYAKIPDSMIEGVVFWPRNL